MSLVKYDPMEVLRLSAFFEEFVDMEVNNQIAHEDVSAWSAPSECHGLVQNGFDKEMEELEKTFGSVDQLFDYFGAGVVQRAINRLHFLRCPFCGKEQKEYERQLRKEVR